MSFVCDKEVVSYTTKNPRDKTISTNLTSIDPSKLQIVSRQHSFGDTVIMKSTKNDNGKS